MPDLTAQISENLREVRGRIADAAARSGRPAEAITLVGVTKYVGAAESRTLAMAGCTALGESRPQQLCEKAETLHDLQVCWHMIGHLQRNKVRRTLPLIDMIESADSPRLVEAIDRIAAGCSRRVPMLLEVNISGETAKHGFDPTAVEPFLEQLAGYRHVEVRGLMCMASFTGGLEAARRDFAALRGLRDRLRGKCPQGVALDELSMGMSGDYEVAIEEGATIVRVGSALFHGVME
ncbi:MAG: YggS family pyridoxal phosphate-dependent enzyme [Pirellulales bacterium]|nr:YggS family pyridoxal phosphate-dependent enzyme [Pirellulales bacterium]